MARLKRLFGLMWLVLPGLCLFAAAGTHHWRGAWLFLIAFIGGTLATMLWLRRTDPELYAERMRGFHRKDQPLWDRVIGWAIALTWYPWLIIMGLGVRTHGAQTSDTGLATGLVIMALGYLLVMASFKANAFAATAVRLQTERHQTVADQGPYAWVRHPIYTASLLIHLGTLLLLGVKTGWFLVPVLYGLIAWRAVLEERLLRQKLAGYDAYTARVHWRLAPGIW